MNPKAILSLTACLLLSTTALATSNQATPPAQGGPAEPDTVDKLTHKEQPEDRPLSPERQRTTARSDPWRNGYRSVQVNVDNNGDNILGDAANEPSLAIDPASPDRMVIGWRQFANVASNYREGGWAYSHDGGQSWTFPGTVIPGVFGSDPVIDVDNNGDFHYMTLSSRLCNFCCEMLTSNDGGVTWSTPIDALGGDKEWMVIDRTGGPGDGNIYAVWNGLISAYDPTTPFIRSIDGGQSFEGPFFLWPTPIWGTVDVGPDGTVYVAGVINEGILNHFIVARSVDGQYPGTTPTFEVLPADLGGSMQMFPPGPNPGGLLGQVWVAADHSGGPTHGNVYLLASVAPYPGTRVVRFSRSTDNGFTWSPAIDVDRDGAFGTQWFGTLSVAPNGRLDVIWNNTVGLAVDTSELVYTYSVDAGITWARKMPASPAFNSYVGWPQQAKLGDYYDMISDNVHANVAYAATFNVEQDVYFVKLGDCNTNGIHDSSDTLDGTSLDCNTNLVPDECERHEFDCNTNGIPDDCDIANATSPDCDANGTPDECDLANGTASDCNTNGVPDTCDLDSGTSADCNFNSIPDECDIAAGLVTDCNANAIPDNCELWANPAIDCNTNSIPDTCDIAAGAADCNSNSIPDACEVAPRYFEFAGRYSPIGDGYPYAHVMHDPPTALGDVRLNFRGYGDFNFTSENITVQLNGIIMGTAMGGGDDCPLIPNEDTFLLPMNWFNNAAETGLVSIDLVPAAIVGPFDCPHDTWITLTVGYAASPPNDCNTNGVPDECDVLNGTSPDVNHSGLPDECEQLTGDCDCDRQVDADDVPFFIAALAGESAWVAHHQTHAGHAPMCFYSNADVNGDGRVDFADIWPFVQLIK
jgi:hypothetical protein